MRSWAIRSAAFEGASWKALPYSKTEVKNVQQLFEEKGHKANTFLYETANKNNFIAEAKKAKFLLIAAHGLVNDEQPDLGGLVFFPSKNISQNFEAKGESNKENESRSIVTETAKQATNDDSILSMKEAYLLNLQDDSVVLSACESGIGKLTKGEGKMVINRGFLHSGASNVIFTLFKVYDKPSSELILLLFTEILGGKPYAEALQAAKLAFLKQKMADPKLWTSYILIGS